MTQSLRAGARTMSSATEQEAKGACVVYLHYITCISSL